MHLSREPKGDGGASKGSIPVVEAPATVVAPSPEPIPVKVTDKNIPPTTTAEDDRKTVDSGGLT